MLREEAGSKAALLFPFAGTLRRSAVQEQPALLIHHPQLVGLHRSEDYSPFSETVGRLGALALAVPTPSLGSLEAASQSGCAGEAQDWEAADRVIALVTTRALTTEEAISLHSASEML